MSLHKVSKGLRLPISGGPRRDLERPRSTRHVALLADDYLGLRPVMQVSVGDDVRRGQVLLKMRSCRACGTPHRPRARCERFTAAIGAHSVRLSSR